MIFGGVLGAAGIAAYAGGGSMSLLASDSPPLNRLVPSEVGRWRSIGSQGLVLPAEAPRSKAYDQELKRIYGGAGVRPMMLVIAYSGRPRQGLLQLHDPQVCYPGAGFSIDGMNRSELPLTSAGSIPVQTFTARAPWRIEQVLYWTRIGDRIMSFGGDQHLAIVKAVLRGEVPNGVLVRISTFGSGPAVLSDIRMFASQLLESAPDRAREALLGEQLASVWVAGAGARRG